MDVKEISFSLSGAAGDYMAGKEKMTAHFDYTMDQMKKRVEDLKGRTYARKELVAHLLRYSERFNAGRKTVENIHALQDENTYVVIGGQQAGLLTGPMYTIHKIISILQLASQQQEKLGVRVVPVFWIAGEDHDIDEVNHIYVMKEKNIKKSVFNQVHKQKSIASETVLDKEVCWNWVQDIFKTYKETAYTNDLLHFIKDCLDKADTYVDFFARIIMELFKEDGLILIDSGDKALRKLEGPFFKTLLAHHEEIQTGLRMQQSVLKESGYTPLIATKEQAVHLFMHIEGERWLLEKEENGLFSCKDGAFTFTYEELQKAVEEKPEIFSNNVVTRPLMQEYLFPTLAFIGGPGEVAYWSELKQVFHAVEFHMPPVITRHMISYVERAIEADMKDIGIAVSDVFQKNAAMLREEWLNAQISEPVNQEFTQAREKIEHAHQALRELAGRINPAMESFAKKNQQKIEQQIAILEREIQKTIEVRHDAELNKLRRIEISLQPLGLLQERVWNVCYYLNEYGFDFIRQAVDLPFDWNAHHKIVKC
ncbi:bacillithiol biosynthesis cysteine-adding enzyme BshC [Bacillus sp. 165]|uniref:bacillithiol biosynthesis cysteine-adding enzyme BshC n=1 Tax=Bacillus sp. 165 TaxID=1529117 RepID=UPI001ADC06E9|nr:bacillithiol biosynthesis cysteine-adding enzyme BshC [Bacillus sp. 165]MBO9130272.1 bacillithiol biosynthesis cysteine-adding enzyme BshC [Bacillus sp. 165]